MNINDWTITEENGQKVYTKIFQSKIVLGIDEYGKPCQYIFPADMSNETILKILSNQQIGTNYDY